MKLNSEARLELFDEAKHLHLVDPLTELLHAAYAPLAAQGLKYGAAYQLAAKTLERLKEGESYLVFDCEQLIGTVTLSAENPVGSCEYYKRRGVYSFGQFAIHPSTQGKGLGSAVMDYLEKRAADVGATELALDTSEHAHDLIRMYKKRGYQIVAHTQWDTTNYRSVIMSKDLKK